MPPRGRQYVGEFSVDSTVECIAVRSAMKKAMENIGERIEVEGAK